MRFLRHSPDIPDALLHARDRGEVVVFCGAGVSRAKAELPDFRTLTKDVMAQLGVVSTSEAKRLWDMIEALREASDGETPISYDQIFSRLEDEFDEHLIRTTIAQRLRPPSDPDLSAHRALLGVASVDGSGPKLITTNFDRLFTLADPAATSWIAPLLPQIPLDEHFTGIVHLHGAVREDYSAAEDGAFIISSADFGDAYLARGWATQFLREVLDRYWVVFVGYSADDPPIRYILEALRKSAVRRDRLFAFQSGTDEVGAARWRSRGGTALPYPECRDHAALWETMDAWAARARDPDAWFARIAAMADTAPQDLMPHERGQVVHAAGTSVGCHKLVSHPPIPAAWLCVFDPTIRYRQEVFAPSGEGEDTIDLFGMFHLDSEARPLHPANDRSRHDPSIPEHVVDVFAETEADRLETADRGRSPFFDTTRYRPLSPRQGALLSWICSILDQPITLWWAATKLPLADEFTDSIRYALRRDRTDGRLSETTTKSWHLLLSANTHNRSVDSRRFSGVGLQDVISKRAGAIAQYLETCKPYISIRPSPMTDIFNEEDKTLSTRDFDAVSVTVEYPRVDFEINEPEALPAVCRGLRRHLEDAIDLACGVEGWFSVLKHNYIAKNGETSRLSYGIGYLMILYIRTFSSLHKSNLSKATEETAFWSKTEPTIFARLWMWYAYHHATPDEAFAIFGRLSRNVLWDFYHEPDLVTALIELWSRFNEGQRAELEQRLLLGPDLPPDGGDPVRYAERRSRADIKIINRLLGMQQRGCTLSDKCMTTIATLQDRCPLWDGTLTDPTEPRIRSFSYSGIDTSTGHLTYVAIDHLLRAALDGISDNWFEQPRDPLAGLCKEKPVRALAAIRRAQDVTEEDRRTAWNNLFQSKLKRKRSDRLVLLLAKRFLQTPVDPDASLLRYASWFLRDNTQILLTRSTQIYFEFWSYIFTSIERNPDLDGSGAPNSQETNWVFRSADSVSGSLTTALVSISEGCFDASSEYSSQDWFSRVDRLLSLGGDSKLCAVCTLATQLGDLEAHNPTWTADRLIGPIVAGSADTAWQRAFWCGIFHRNTPLAPEVFVTLKPEIVKLPNRFDRQFADAVGISLYAYWRSGKDDQSDTVLTDEDFREVLVDGGGDLRVGLLQWLRTDLVSKNQECSTIIEFLDRVWPKQRSANGPNECTALYELLIELDEAFPQGLTLLKPLLSFKGTDMRWMTHQLEGADTPLAQRFPEECLTLFDLVHHHDTDFRVYRGVEVLTMIAQAQPTLASDPRFRRLRSLYPVQ